MKCKNCGNELNKGEIFCTKCGHQVIDNEEMAFFITSQRHISKELVGNTLEETVNNSINWVRDNTDLFNDIQEIDGDELQTINCFPNDLYDLDYEERIIYILKFVLGKKDEEIIQTLNIEANLLHYCLVSCNEKINSHDVNIVKEERVKKVKKDKIRVNPKVLVPLIIIVCLIAGTVFGIKRYAKSQFEKGNEYLENNNYELAVEAYLNAYNYGLENDSSFYLGYCYYALGDYDESLKYYKKLELNDSVKKDIYNVYIALSNKYIKEKDYGTASNYLKEGYELLEDETLNRRYQACNSDDLEFVDGNLTYDVYGHLIKINNDNYQIDINYKNNSISNIQAYVKKGSKKKTITKLDSDIYFYTNSNGSVGYTIHQRDMIDDELVSESYISEDDTTLYNYSSDVYNYKDGLVDSISHEDGSVSYFNYDDDELVSIERKNGIFNTISSVKYEYDNNNLVKEIRNGFDDVNNLKISGQIDYANTKLGYNDKYTMYDSTNNVIYKAYYINDMGWLILGE